MARRVSTGTWRWGSSAAVLFVLFTAAPARAQLPDAPVVPVEIPTELPSLDPIATPDPRDIQTQLPDALPILPGEDEPEPEGGGTTPGTGGTEPGTEPGGPLTSPVTGTTTNNSISKLVVPKPVTGVPAGVANEAYGTIAGRELGAAAGRALDLAGPLAPALLLAIVALVMVALVSRGGNKLVRAEPGADRRVYRL